MKLHKRLMQVKFTVGCKDNYEQHARITLWKLGSNTYKIVAEEFDMHELEYEKFVCGRKKSRIIWSNLLHRYSDLEEVYRTNPY